MTNLFSSENLMACGLNEYEAKQLAPQLNTISNTQTTALAWSNISRTLLTPAQPFKLHLFIFSSLYPDWYTHPENAPAWLPSAEIIKTANITQLMKKNQCATLNDFHTWTITQRAEFLAQLLAQLAIPFKKSPVKIEDLSNGIEAPIWLAGAQMNIADSCFLAANSATAIIFQDTNKKLQHISFSTLNHLSNQIANGLATFGFKAGDAIAIDMPMTVNAIAIYLGIIKMGGVVVSIADSFAPAEIASRLRIASATGIFTQDYILRGAKRLPLYEKVKAANAPKTIVIPCENASDLTLQAGDLFWADFLSVKTEFNSVSCDPQAPITILFSSGTTGDPKAIPWNHTTALKVAMDAYLHQNIQTNDVLAWPTNLGWMMGPWLIFAALINRAAIAIYHDAPRDQGFGKFIQDAKVTMLGVVPTLVAQWRQTECMQGLNWDSIKVFSSTGECSNPEDMLYLMARASYKPIIEYCGGTEIGGSYLTSTVVENNHPSLFTTPAMGLDFILLDENGKPTNMGEVAIVPPALGLSTQLLNANHHNIYFANMPKTAEGIPLRRHGDQVKKIANKYYSVLGRLDDTMNLGAIKVSSAEIERVITGIDKVTETAAIAISPQHNGPSQLVIFAVTQFALDKMSILKEMQNKINSHLNPLFKIHDVIFVTELPKTASNKIMRRVLRDQSK